MASCPDHKTETAYTLYFRPKGKTWTEAVGILWCPKGHRIDLVTERTILSEKVATK